MREYVTCTECNRQVIVFDAEKPFVEYRNQWGEKYTVATINVIDDFYTTTCYCPWCNIFMQVCCSCYRQRKIISLCKLVGHYGLLANPPPNLQDKYLDNTSKRCPKFRNISVLEKEEERRDGPHFDFIPYKPEETISYFDPQCWTIFGVNPKTKNGILIPDCPTFWKCPECSKRYIL